MKVKITLIVILSAIIYAVIGGVIFHYLEQGYEKELLPEVLQELSQYTYGNGDACLNWTDFDRLKGIVENLDEGGYYISPSGQLIAGTKWDIRTSIFASVSVFTSVGFHRLSPDYTWARLFCVIYGWLGIPLFFSAIKTFDKCCGKTVKVIGRHICGRIAHKRAGWIIANIVAFVIGFILFVLIPAVIFSHLESWSYAESIYFCFSTIFTIGFSDYTPGFNREALPSEEFMKWYRLATAFWVLILLVWFLSYVLCFISFIDKSAEQSEHLINEKIARPTDIHETEVQAKWMHGTSVMINGEFSTGTACRKDTPPLTSGPVNRSVAVGSHYEWPTHNEGQF